MGFFGDSVADGTKTTGVTKRETAENSLTPGGTSTIKDCMMLCRTCSMWEPGESFEFGICRSDKHVVNQSPWFVKPDAKDLHSLFAFCLVDPREKTRPCVIIETGCNYGCGNHEERVQS